ncbi:MAG: hypothetical protein CBD33_01090 [Euryarchaeota archaeon TMED173]|nr:MAG: hypothetical protein CBD33_01090 [Euryarchaeota archaeon TMED173]|tara:strand:+ start:78 stop:614 length:537 start_codon:yes stop_codon:yes gene_type:complete
MQEGENEWSESLLRPSSTLSVGSFVIGSWMAFLTVVNIFLGAYSEGRKVNWIDFFMNGDETNSIHEIGIEIGDIAFGILSIIVISIGYLGITSSTEDGFGSWIRNLSRDVKFASLFSSENGVERTLASWVVLLGVLFYFLWSILETTWVDPGVYSVTISLIAIGMGIHWIQDSKISSD